MARPTKVNSLQRLRRAGMPIDAIVDVGIMEQTRELKQVFPDVKHFLFEPVAEFYPTIRANYADIEHELIEAAASDSDGTSILNVRALTGSKLSHSNLSTNAGAGAREVRTLRLDTFFQAHPDRKNLALKVDVDGAELRVLAGAKGILPRVNCIILEASRSSFADRSRFLFEHGYGLFDIVDICYYYGGFHQADLVFLRNDFFQTPAFNGWLNPGFEPSQWVSLDESAFPPEKD